MSKRVMGIEPTLPAWKAGVLPLNYTRKYKKMAKKESSLFKLVLTLTLVTLIAAASLAAVYSVTKDPIRNNFV